MSKYSKCKPYVYTVGDTEHGPGTCPMHYDFPVTEELYVDPETRRVARVAAQVEGAGYRCWRRAEEIIEFARRLGFSKLGVAFCSEMSRVAELYIDVLRGNGFETISAGCLGMGCDPLAQATLCNDGGTELNVLLGMCVGHDSLFIKHSKAFVTCLVAKDRFLVHNPVGALYGAKGYFRQALREHKAKGIRQTCTNLTVRQVATVAAQVINEGHGRWTRVEETMEFAQRLGIIKLGLIFCAGLRHEAGILTDILEANRFEALSVRCKAGAVPKEWIGVLDSEKLRPGKLEMMCNPIAQAELLNRNQTKLNILMGQCVGHDSLSIKHSEALVTYLIAKDRVLAHNTIASLYESKGYLGEALYQEHQKLQKVTIQPASDNLLLTGFKNVLY